MTSTNYYGFILLDFDDFKYINDTYGHITGDEILKIFSECLLRIFRKEDILSRLGGDEFIIFIPKLYPISFLEQKIVELCKLYKDRLENHYPEIQHKFSGGGIWGNQKTSFSQLYKQADLLLYEAKRKQKGTIIFTTQTKETDRT